MATCESMKLFKFFWTPLSFYSDSFMFLFVFSSELFDSAIYIISAFIF